MNPSTLTDQDISALCRGLALLLHAGIPLADGLFLMAQEEKEPMNALLTRMGRHLDEGGALSDAMEDTLAFPHHAPGTVRIGERTGRLEEALDSLARYYEERQRIARRLRSALAYPSMILLLMLCVVGILLVKVLPVFDEVYASLGSRLTGIAAGLLGLGRLLESALPVLLGLLAAVAAAVLLFCCWMPFREKATALFRSRFGDRGVTGKFNNARFARALAMGLSSGLPLDEAMSLAQMLLSDVPGAADRCARCAALLSQGASLADAMGSTQLLPPASCRMLTLGIKGGNADRVMEEIADRLMDDAADALDGIISRVEPAMVLSASVLVGMILLSVMLPLMNIMSSIG